MLLGRDQELRAIERALADARLGRSSALLIRGEPGVGKTALLGHAIAQADAMRVLSARGVEFEADVPFAGLHELLLPTLHLLERLPPVHAAALRSSLGLGERLGSDRLLIGAATLELISLHAEEGPVLVAVDDAQWLDRASAEAVAFAARRLLADPVAILVTIRAAEDSPLLHAGLAEIKLDALERSFARALFESAAPAPVSDEVARRVLDATGGNPLALLEMARESSSLALTPSDTPLPVATTVERAYLRRAVGLSAGARRALLLLAASGAAELELVQRAAAAVGIDAGQVQEAEGAAGLVVQRANRLEFVHPLARAAIYHAASPAERRAAHSALATVTTATDEADRRAWHLAAAAAGRDEAAATALDAAAKRARERSAYAAAAGAFEEAARLTESAEPRTRRLLEAADNAWLAGRGDQAVQLLEAARTHATDALTRAQIDSLGGTIAMQRGLVMDGYRTLVGVAEVIRSVDRPRAIRLLADAALGTYSAGYPTVTLAAARQALDLLEPGDAPETMLVAYTAYGALAVLAGQGADGIRHLRMALPLFDSAPLESGDPFLLHCAGMTGAFLREAEAGRDLLDRALNAAREYAPAAALPTVLFFLGRDAATTEHWPLARARYEESARVARETTQQIWLAAALAGTAWLDALEGRVEECQAHAAMALAIATEYGMAIHAAWSHIALGQLELGFGRPEQAIQHMLDCQSLLEEVGISDPDLAPAPDLVDAYVRVGRLEEARAVAEAYRPVAVSKGQPFALARAFRSLALLAGDGEYAELFEEALRHHLGTLDTFERARTQLYFGERLRRARRRVDARKQLRSALQAFDRLGAKPWAERARAELQASGESARARDDSQRHLLTPQELQVALTLAEGRTTREAAAKLYLSPKTVEYHLRNIYDKLEIRSRDELQAALAGSGQRRKCR